MASIPIKYSPKEKNAPPLPCQLGGKSYSLPPNKVVYIDREDWEVMSRSVRFKPLIESGELSLSAKSEKSEKFRQPEKKEEPPEPIPVPSSTLSNKLERPPPKKD
jgi:hypothetical protein